MTINVRHAYTESAIAEQLSIHAQCWLSALISPHTMTGNQILYATMFNWELSPLPHSWHSLSSVVFSTCERISVHKSCTCMVHMVVMPTVEGGNFLHTLHVFFSSMPPDITTTNLIALA